MADSIGRRRPGSTDSYVASGWTGLPVIDKAGSQVGRVEFVKLGDPAASASSEGLITSLSRANSNDHPDLSTKLAERLLRLGFVKVTGSGAIDHDLYIPADEIASVVDGTVLLTVSIEDLSPQSELLAHTLS